MGVKAWGEHANSTLARSDSDMYGGVVWEVHDFLRDRGVTPRNWAVLIERFGNDHDSACEWVARHQTGAGHYDVLRSEDALASATTQEAADPQ